MIDMDELEIMNHIKDLTPASMIVFIDMPFHWEETLRYMPFFAHDNFGFAKPKDDGWQLTNRGYHTAKEAVESMTREGLFFSLYKKELQEFYTEYSKKESRVAEELRVAKERTRSDTDWRNHATLLKEQMKIDKKLQSLFPNMYSAWFGKKAPVIDEEDYYNLLELTTGLPPYENDHHQP